MARPCPAAVSAHQHTLDWPRGKEAHPVPALRKDTDSCPAASWLYAGLPNLLPDTLHHALCLSAPPCLPAAAASGPLRSTAWAWPEGKTSTIAGRCRRARTARHAVGCACTSAAASMQCRTHRGPLLCWFTRQRAVLCIIFLPKSLRAAACRGGAPPLCAWQRRAGAAHVVEGAHGAGEAGALQWVQRRICGPCWHEMAVNSAGLSKDPAQRAGPKGACASARLCLCPQALPSLHCTPQSSFPSSAQPSAVAFSCPSPPCQISVDMSQPAVPSEGNLDPFDGLVTYRLLQGTGGEVLFSSYIFN